VKIEADGLTIAAQLEEPIKTVVTMKVDVFLPRPNTIAVRIRHVRAGNLPWSPSRLTEEISKIAQKNRVPLHWTQTEQDPVAMLTIVSAGKDKSTEITACQLEDGKLYMAGVTKPSKKRP
jgi:hypothetical protein